MRQTDVDKKWLSQAAILLASVVIGWPWLAAADSSEGARDSGFNRAFYTVDELNGGLAPPAEPVNLQTPQAALENFILSSREDDFERAAHSLNLNLIPQSKRPDLAAELARKLFYIVEQTLWIEWDSIPDTPDALVELSLAGNNRAALQPRRSIKVGSIALGARNVSMRLARVKPKNGDPEWVISSQTIENIDALYDQYGPSILDRHLPDWMKPRLAGKVPLWEWFMLGVLALFSILLGWGLQKLALHWLKGLRGGVSTGLAHALSGPLATLIALALFSLGSSLLLSLSGPFASFFRPMITLLTVTAATWAVMSAITYFSEHLRQRYAHALEGADEPRTRQLLTHISVARRVLLLIAVMLGLGIALSQLDLFETIGLSLLASAGLVSVILGVSAHSVLGNIMAGIQIALTRLVNIGDNVKIAGEWGYVEEITYTYMTVRTWDQRRLIVPLKRLLQEPLENWSKTREHLVAPIYLYVDYAADVGQLRAKYAELLVADPDYSGELEPSMQVTHLSEETMQLRALCPAPDADAAWRLHCRLREKLVAYVQSLEQGAYLPRRRLQWQSSAADQA